MNQQDIRIENIRNYMVIVKHNVTCHMLRNSQVNHDKHNVGHALHRCQIHTNKKYYKNDKKRLRGK